MSTFSSSINTEEKKFSLLTIPSQWEVPSQQYDAISQSHFEPQPPPVTEPKNTDTVNAFYLVREKIYPIIDSTNLLKLGLQLDSDVYSYNMSGAIDKKPIIENRNRYITNNSFKDLNELQMYLRDTGKIPSYLELQTIDGKGYGVFTKRDVKAMTFLGYYQGQYRPHNSLHENLYGYNFTDFENKTTGYIDAENITFSNWARFINDGDSTRYNVEYSVYNYQIFIFSTKDIKAGEELVGNYGDSYWKAYETKTGLKKLP